MSDRLWKKKKCFKSKDHSDFFLLYNKVKDKLNFLNENDSIDDWNFNILNGWVMLLNSGNTFLFLEFGYLIKYIQLDRKWEVDELNERMCIMAWKKAKGNLKQNHSIIFSL